MKTFFAFLLALFLPVAALAAEAELNLTLSYWGDGAEDAQGAMLLQMSEGHLLISTYDVDGNETTSDRPIDAENRALMSAAIEAMIALTNTKPAEETSYPMISVEWSLLLPSNFARGYISIPFDQQPPEILAIQDQVFGARLDMEAP